MTNADVSREELFLPGGKGREPANSKTGQKEEKNYRPGMKRKKVMYQ